MKLRKEFITIFIIQITEILGFSLILPFLPLFAQEFGASPIVIGLILTAFSLFQFVSAPIMGRLSDHYGRKPLLILSQFSTFISFLILGFANSLWMIFLSRIVDGLIGSNFTIAQAYLSDISTRKDRTKMFGYSGVAFGIGFLIGPGIGGFLSGISFSIPAFLAAAVSGVTILITLFALPETVKRKKDFKISLKLFHLDDFRKYFKNRKTSPKLWHFFMYILAHVVWVSTFAIYAERQLGMGPEMIGYMLAIIGLIIIILRAGVLPKMIKNFGEERLRYVGIISIISAMVGSAFATNFETFIFIAVMSSFGHGILRPVLFSRISKSVSDKEQGSALGVANSLGSMAQIVGPLMGGFMMNYFFPGSLGLLAALILSIGLVMMLREK